MKTLLRRYRIVNLDGFRNYEIEFFDNRLILVGENGSGKTTVSRMLYYLLSRDWRELFTYNFEELSLEFDFGGKLNEISINQKKLLEIISNSEQLPEGFFDFFDSTLEFDKSFLLSIMELFQESLEPEGTGSPKKSRFLARSVLTKTYRDISDDEEFKKIREAEGLLRDAFEGKLLYLPTYRRIEEDVNGESLDSSGGGRSEHEKQYLRRKDKKRNKSSELIRFGMKDVEAAISHQENRLIQDSQLAQNKLTEKYLHDILSEKYAAIDTEKLQVMGDHEVSEVLDRIDGEILDAEEKNKVSDIVKSVRSSGTNDDHDVATKIICHYFSSLIGFYKDLQSKEKCFIDFQDNCNLFLVNNKVVYDKKNFSCQVKNRLQENYGAPRDDAKKNSEERVIELDSLSSGEKQIVALFSRLFLETDEELFIFIDEPELSLSIEWQRKLLPSMLSAPCCSGLYATTHSPFIFDNGLEAYVHGINEFVVDPND